MKPKLTIIAPVHKATDIRVVKKQCCSAVQAGFDISLFATGELEETLQGKIKYHQLHYRSRVSRFLLQPKIFIQALKTKSNIFHIHNPDTLFIGLFLKLCGKTVVYDTHECFKDKIMLRRWIPVKIRAVVATLVNFLEYSSAKVFDATLVTQTRQLTFFNNSLLIGNAPILKRKELPRNKPVSPIKLVYVGGVSFDRGLAYMLELVSIINKQQNAFLHIIGPIVNEINESDILNKIIGNPLVEYIGEVEQNVALEYVEKSHFGLILLEDQADYKYTDPNKLYEYMMHGTIYVATNFQGWKDKLEEHSTGFFIDSDGINDKLASDMIKLVNSTELYQLSQTKNLDFIKETYNWEEHEAPKLLSLYDELIDK